MRGAVLLLARARLRSSRRRIVALVLLTALGGGISLAVAAGARRTMNAGDAILDLSNGYELGIGYGSGDPDEATQQISAMPAVGDFTQIAGFQTLLSDIPVPGLTSFGFYTDPVRVERPLMLEGRLPDTAHEVFLNEAGAAVTGASIGDQLEVVIANQDYSEFLPETMVVTGIGLLPDEVYEDETGAKPTVVYAKEFVDTYRDLIAWGAAYMTVTPDARRADAVAQLSARGLAVDNDRATDRDTAREAIRPLGVTLGVLALLAAVATIVVIGQALRRLVRRSPGDTRSLMATGTSPRILLAADVGIALTVSAAGAIGAVAVAIAASPLFPQGRARRVPGLGGIDIDVAALGLGAAALLVALPALVVTTSLRRTRSRQLRPGTAPGALGSRPAIGTGVRFATGRRGLAGTVGGVAVGLASVVAAVVFTGSMSHLVSRPALAGFNWDLMGRNIYASIDIAAVTDRLRDDPEVERITGLTFSDATIDGSPMPASVWAGLKGAPWPSLATGRAPEGPNEVMLGQQTLDDLGYKIGDTVAIALSAADEFSDAAVTIRMTVVGTAVSPPVAIPGADTPRLDQGVLVRQEDIAGLNVDYGGAVLFDLADGADPEAIKAQFPEGLPDDTQSLTDWFETAQPAEVIQSRDAISVLELAIAVLLIGIMATVAHNLLAFVRQRRNAFAVLKAVGFTPGQIRSTVLWQSGLVVGVALVAAVPLGIAAGRRLYQGFAGGIGVIVQPTLPLLALAAAVVGAVVLVQAVALVPARQARRTNAARELRWE